MTDIIEWQSKYILDYPIVDEQHKELVLNINKLFDMLSGNSSDVISFRIIKDLADYAVYHLKTEEGLMLDYKYPFMVEHINSHNVLRNKIKEITNHVKQGNMEIMSVNLLKFLLDWLNEHITKEDKRLIKYINQLTNEE